MSVEPPYLQAVEDGLPMRRSQSYALRKLKALEFYLAAANTAIHEGKWAGRYFIDLQAGPGKNRIGSTVALGSPLIALLAPHPATRFFFNELNPTMHQALTERVSASPLRDRVTLYQADANEIVHVVIDEIQKEDRTARLRGKWSVLNFAFLDPEGLELDWSTVSALARMKRMDLIINFSTGGLLRAIGKGHFEAVDRFFGTAKWREVYDENKGPNTRRKALIDFYRHNLEKFGYQIINIDQGPGGEYIPVQNSKNVQVYSMIFASKHPLGSELWGQAAKSVQPPKLPGFE